MKPEIIEDRRKEGLYYKLRGWGLTDRQIIIWCFREIDGPFKAAALLLHCSRQAVADAHRRAKGKMTRHKPC